MMISRELLTFSACICEYFVCCSSQKTGSVVGATKASFLGGKRLSLKKFTAPAAGTRSFTVSAAAAADPNRPLWFPGSTPPPWLDGRFSVLYILCTYSNHLSFCLSLSLSLSLYLSLCHGFSSFDWFE